MKRLLLIALLLSATPLAAAERRFESMPNEREVQSIRYIVEGLGNHGVAWIVLHIHALKEAGRQIKGVHPLRFVEAIFTDEAMKVAVRNLRRRGGTYWSEFMDGLRGSFAEECNKGNLTEDQIRQLAQNLEVDPAIILPAAMAGQWDRFVALLIENVPRKGNFNRWNL